MSDYTIETITPVHIGSGVLFQKNTEFLLKNDFIGIIDPSKVLGIIGEAQISTWVAMIERGEPLMPYLMKRKHDLELEDVCSRTMNYFAENIGTSQSLKEQIHTGTAHPYIPGSSIKGAIRTALFTKLIKALGIVSEQMLKNKKSHLDDGNLSRKLFGKDPNHDSLRFLRVGDAIFDKGTTIALNMMSLNHRHNSTRLDSKVSQLTEAIGQEITATIRIDIDKQKLSENLKRHKISTDVSFLNSDTELLQTINKHTINLLKAELKSWEEHAQFADVENYINEIKQLLETAENCKEDEAILRLGHGSGWNFMTGAWQKDSSLLTDDHAYDQIINRSRPGNQKKYAEYMFPKTRRMDEEGFLLGFIKIQKNNKMAVNLIVTLGDRDLTIKQEIEGIELRRNPVSNNFYLANNVDGAVFITNHLNKFYDLIDFPIIIPAIEYLLAKHREINNLILVVTNQQQNADVSEYHKRKDTFELAKLLTQFLRKKYGSKVGKIKESYVSDNIIYHDSMFDAFAEKLSNHPFKFQQDDALYLFAQSGIDAINTALLLNCIEQYPQTVQLNKPENSPVAFPLTFPNKFYKRLLTGKVLHALENYNYAAIFDLNYAPEINHISKYAFARMTFDFDEAKEQLAHLCTIDEGNRSFYTNLISYLDFTETGLQGKIVEMYLSAKVLLKRYAYSDFLVRIFTITEIILKPKVMELLGGEFDYSLRDNHHAWNMLLESKPELLDHLKNKVIYGGNLKFNEPNKFVYKAIVDYFNKENGIADDSFDNLFNHLLELSFLRNQVAHGLIKVNETDINHALKKVKSNLEQFIALADSYFGVEGMGDYKRINEHLKALLAKAS